MQSDGLVSFLPASSRPFAARSVAGGALLVTFASLFTTVAVAQEIARPLGASVDVWSEPNPGVRYLRRTIDEPAIAVHALVVDTSADGVRVVATPYRARWGTVTDFAQEQGAVAAINGGFWGLLQRPAGIAAGGGALWDTAEPDPDFGHFGVQRGGRAFVREPGEGEDERSLAALTDAVSGRPTLVTDGAEATEILDAFGSANLRQPRTAIGVSRDGKTVYIAVSDGRQSHSRGLTLYQLARLMVELGAHRAINLDGGGSSAMYVEEAGGLVSSPARGRWVRALGLEESETRRVRTRGGEREAYVRGVEREVMNQIAVIAPAPVSAPIEAQASQSALADGLAPMERPSERFVPATAAPFRVGKLREVLYPSLLVLAALVGFCALLLVGRALRRRWPAVRARLSSARADRRATWATARRSDCSSRT